MAAASRTDASARAQPEIGASPYDAVFFEATTAGASASARAIVPIVVELVRPRSVVDVGCGLGAWLAVFREQGVADVLGVDGDYVRRDQLRIPQDAFVPHDLEQPLRVDRRFDLAISLEVAEHLSPQVASAFVESLVRLAPVVLFSAAIPDQGGVDHRNEQWQEYWTARFREHGYEAIDAIRPRVWEDAAVEAWYAQNMLLYVARDELERREALLRESREPRPFPLRVVHPRMYAGLAYADRHPSTRELLRMLPAALRATVRWRLTRR